MQMAESKCQARARRRDGGVEVVMRFALWFPAGVVLIFEF
jgi:hypothetical protein